MKIEGCGNDMPETLRCCGGNGDFNISCFRLKNVVSLHQRKGPLCLFLFFVAFSAAFWGEIMWEAGKIISDVGKTARRSEKFFSHSVTKRPFSGKTARRNGGFKSKRKLKMLILKSGCVPSARCHVPRSCVRKCHFGIWQGICIRYVRKRQKNGPRPQNL